MFVREQVGFDGTGAPLYEYRLDGTSIVIIRMDPTRPHLGGWTVWDEETRTGLADFHRLADAKAWATR